ncbi:MAG TPA: hypothetical protein VMW54_04280 [Terriglobia bacterium]|nr:hypothetical protein [Terriglobia bacterium]
MRRLTQLGVIGVLSVFSLLLMGPAIMLGQQTSNNQSTLTLKQVKQQLKQNQQYLKQAEKQGKAGNSAGLQTALNNYDRGMSGLNTALSQGHFNGSLSQQEDAYNRVQKATQKHIDVLNGLLSKVPAQAVPHIQHAIDVSKTGQTTALNHLSTLHTQQAQAMGQGNHPGMGQGQGMGRSQGAGSQGGFGHMGGAAPMGGMGASMGHGGGPPMGHPGR